ncbi:MAG: pilus assembly protein TadG-related protein, partial [Actinomycetota bacterium]|nr:pilus assembly protein TadG-related protein [Actinomycetota bacterium]
MSARGVFSARRTDERGVVAVFVVLSLASFMFAAAALGVDVAQLHLEAQRVQKAADAGALGGVTYLPQDLPSATTAARDISARNGFPNSGSSTVAVVPGATASQLRVTVCSTTTTTFGGMFGAGSPTICRSGVADYTGPAPMGSPCNTFGNEPTPGSTTAATPTDARGASPLTNCSVNPQFWATVEGPATDKIFGDRYQTVNCTAGVDGCVNGKNTEYDNQGYFWLVRVQQSAVNTPIDLQLFDPEFVNTNQTCGNLPSAASWINSANVYVTDAKARYSPSSATGSATVAPTCTGDLVTTGNSLMTTSFALRQQTDTLDPRKSLVQNDTSGNPCIKQYTGQLTSPTTAQLLESTGTYQTQLASVFHNWTSLCTFTPTRAGDYYLQVRTNVSPTGPVTITGQKGSTIIYAGNTNVVAATGNLTAGDGNNAFGIRAVSNTGLEHAVSVSGYDRMPIYANATGASSTLNLIRVLPGGAGKSISFSYYDVGDIASANGPGSVQVLTPTGATFTGSAFPNGGCRASGGKAGIGPTSLTNCTAPFDAASNGSNNGKTETIIIPIPSDYNCDYTQPQ